MAYAVVPQPQRSVGSWNNPTTGDWIFYAAMVAGFVSLPVFALAYTAGRLTR